MRQRLLGTLATLVVMAAATGCADTPTAASSEAAGISANVTSPLAVSLGPCDAKTCRAVASGGTGAGYYFTWSNAYESFSGTDYSVGYPKCPGLSVPTYIRVGATVRDSSGATATAYRDVYCPSRYDGGGHTTH